MKKNGALCLLLNLQLDNAFLLTIFIVGQMPLAEKVRTLPQFDTRIAARGLVRPLERDDISGYIQLRLQVAGQTKSLFSNEAVELITQYTGGIPRQVNHICDLCLATGFGLQVKTLDNDLVYELILREESSRV